MGDSKTEKFEILVGIAVLIELKSLGVSISKIPPVFSSLEKRRSWKEMC